jgi:hypothetical protein
MLDIELLIGFELGGREVIAAIPHASRPGVWALVTCCDAGHATWTVSVTDLEFRVLDGTGDVMDVVEALALMLRLARC